MKSYVFYLIFTLEFFLLLVLLYRRWRYRSFLTLKSKPLTLREISSQQVIPKVLHQTYKDVARIPRKVYENIREFAPEYEHLVYSDSDVVSFLSTNFKPEVLQAFHTLKLGAHKADLFRYCILYVKGGVYLDIKTELIKPLDKLFKDGAINTVISRVSSEIYQGVKSKVQAMQNGNNAYILGINGGITLDFNEHVSFKSVSARGIRATQ